jgi:hypothetical protein
MTQPPKFDDAKQYWLSGKTLNQIGRAIVERTPIAGDGLLHQKLPQGVILTNNAQGSEGDPGCIFQAEVAGGDFRFTTAGSILNGGMPSNMFSAGQLWSVAVGATETAYILLDVTTSGNALTGCTLRKSSTPADPIGITEGVAPAAFEIDLWVVINRVPYRVIGCGGLSAAPIVALTTSAESPVCSGDPYVRHYTWEVRST